MAKKINKIVSKDLDEVKAHYLDYPYPLRNPEDEKTRLLSILGENLREINHYLFKGKQTFNNGFRALVAGGGTGDSSTFLAEQLRDKNAEVVYLDFSKNSMEIAKKRAEIRGLKNITFINDSILNIHNLKLGKFDYINCSGVLHHLASPQEGLRALQESLKAEGGMHIMVYAKYGRTAIYQMQDIMKIANDGVTERTEEVKNAKIILESLPATNWYKRSEDLISDVKNYGDVGIYDLFLHKQDRCYSIPELYEFIESADLNFVEFSEILPRLSIRIENFIKNPELLQKIKAMPIKKQHEIAEIITGNIIKHTFFASNIKDSVAHYELENIPFFFSVGNFAKQICDYIDNNNVSLGNNINMTINSIWVPSGINVSLGISAIAKSIFKHMQDEPNTKTFKEIFDLVRKDIKDELSDNILIEESKKLLQPLIDSGVLLFRHKSGLA